MIGSSIKRVLLIVTIGVLAASGSLTAHAQSKNPTLEWFSWSIFRLTSTSGKVFLTNPFVVNPFSQVTVDDFKKVDYILVPTGHGDEIGQTAEIALKTGAKIFTTFTFARGYFGPRKISTRQIFRVGPGSRVRVDGMTVRAVNAVHGSTTREGLSDASAMGYFITFENGLTVYFAGSTAVTMDMQLWGRLYKPDVAILPLGPSTDPGDVVEMVKLLRTDNPNLKTIVPHHHNFGLKVRANVPAKRAKGISRRYNGGTKPADLAAALKKAGLPVRLLDPELGKVYELTK
ncbi:MAG: MBL fold metallo-hydrolase [Alphaproteobacteria bacterium]|nr:MBL fold metallo-hydrolase [Alphaproteobacteria bacterium]